MSTVGNDVDVLVGSSCTVASFTKVCGVEIDVGVVSGGDGCTEEDVEQNEWS